MSFLDHVELLPPDPILGLPILFAADKNEKKVNLGIGTYRDEKGQPVVFSAIKKAENLIHQQGLNKEYLPIEGSASYIDESLKLVYGDSFPKDLMTGVQTLGGTSALRLAADFFQKHKHSQIYLSNPSWANHRPIFEKAGMTVLEYPYYDFERSGFNFDAMCQFVEKVAPESIVLLHAGCHNPTGFDPTQDQWKQLSEVIKKRRVIPLFDLAYQGFGTGLEEDAWSVRYFAEQGHEMFVAGSYSKNFGLYGERVGMLSWIVHSKETIEKLLSQFKSIIRGIYSSPPLHGSRLISTVLASPELKKEWANELEKKRQRIHKMRIELMHRLNSASSRDFSFMEKQNGMFSLSGLDANQVLKLRNDFGIYMLNSGRMTISGLTMSNIDYVADSIIQVMKS